MIVESIMDLHREFFPETKHQRPGTILWATTKAGDGAKVSWGKRAESYGVQMVQLPLVTKSDIESRMLASPGGDRNAKRSKMFRREMATLVRLVKSAAEQGGLLTVAEVSLLMNRSLPKIHDHIRAYEAEMGEALPLKGSVLDMGSSPTHKGIICGKFEEGMSPPDIARATSHNLGSVDKYLGTYGRIKVLLRKGFDAQAICQVTGKGPRTVAQYLEIVDLYTIDHLSTPKIADVMTERRYNTPGSSIDGKRPISMVWTSDMILRILKNTAYYGESTYFTRQYETAVCKETRMPYHKRTLKKSNEEGVVIKFPPLITKVKWDEIQSQIKYNKKKPRTNRRKHATETFLVSDTLGRQFRCGLCGSKIAAKVRKRYRSGRIFYQYMCAKHYQSKKQLKAKGYEKCPLPSVDSRDADFEVWKEISLLIANPIKFLRTWLPKKEFNSKDNRVAVLHEKLKRKKTGFDRMTDLIATIEDDSMVQSYINKQHGLSKEISRIEASIKTLKREQHTSAEAIKYLRKVVSETEDVITRAEEEVEAGGDIDGFVIPSVYDKLEAITDFDIRRRILSSVVAPENGGYVELTYNFDKNEGAIEHDVKVNAMLNVQRVANIIKTIRNEGGLKNISKLSNGCERSGGAHHGRTKLTIFNPGFGDQIFKRPGDIADIRPGPQTDFYRLTIH